MNFHCLQYLFTLRKLHTSQNVMISGSQWRLHAKATKRAASSVVA